MKTRRLWMVGGLLAVVALALAACSGVRAGDTAASDPEPAEKRVSAVQAAPTGTPIIILPRAGGTEEGEASGSANVAPSGVDRSAFVVAASAPQAEARERDAGGESASSGVDRSLFVVAIKERAGEAETAEAVPSAEEPAEEALPEGCLDAKWAADVTVPDGTVLEAEERFSKVWRIRNSGSCDWGVARGGLEVGFVAGAQMGGPGQVPVASTVASGGETDVELELTAPAEPGVYRGTWSVRDASGEAVGSPFWVQIEVLGVASAAGFGGSGTGAEAEGLAREVWQRINGERDAHGLHQLAYNERLARAAQKHAEDCSRRDLPCSHTGSDGSDERVRTREEGYVGSVDESWAWQGSPAEAVHLWLDEVPPNDPHRRMLLSTSFTELGVGIAPAPSGYYFVAVFGVTGH